jgi:hypothetical protein
MLIAILLAILVAAGCGSSGSSSGSSEASTAAGSTSASSAESSKGEVENEFAIPGGKNEMAEFGKEASDSEREAASVVLEENLQARAGHEWAAQCASLSALGVKTIEENPKNKGQTCAQVLESEGSKAPKKVLENTLDGEIDVLRVEGPKAFALWHGSDGYDYGMAMENENGQWKVAALVTNQLPKAEPESKSESKSKAKSSPNSG